MHNFRFHLGGTAMNADNKPQAQDSTESGRAQEPRESVLTRVRAAAHDLGERVRKALGRDDDTRPPGFNGLMLVA
ncbi:hypothetical protein C1280_02960 [Gemmata obscuriglobus]|uniref:Uncharacterized protein n=2 Tax=Gemmata obscuriglobus TaxID=114 RepID=A0A2Z3H4Y6_9BACT|nr:hypothetical protein C1280_02960 [Gemmata obscuriglobus]